MGSGHVFLSYSRRQFYAARQLATALTADGVETWFDVERLAPGTDWDAAINQAVDAAGALVVLASADAVASAYVAQEWRRALSRGIPVYVAVARGVRLPPELAGLPRVDLRRRFEPGAHRLAATLRGGDALPAPPRWRWARWPAGVLLVAAALAFNALAALGLLAGAALDMDYPVPEAHRLASAAMAATGLVYAGWLLQPLRGFCTGRARLISLTMPLYGTVPLLFIVWGVVGSLLSAANHGSSVINGGLDGEHTEPFVLVLLPLLVVNVAALRVLHRSPAVLRHLPAGEGPRRLLARLDARAALLAAQPATPSAAGPPSGPSDSAVPPSGPSASTVPPSGPSASAVPPSGPSDSAVPPSGPSGSSAVSHGAPIASFAVEHAEADALIAERIAAAFRSAGAKLVTGGADLTLVVISNATTWAEAADRLRRNRSVAVLACGVRLPADAEELHRIQWLDCRDGRDDRLREFAETLVRATGRGADWSADRGPAVPVPRAADVFDAPRPAKIALECLVAAAAVFALSAAFTVGLAPPSEERVHSTVPRMVPNPPVVITPTPWRQLLDCGPGVPATPGAFPMPVCRFHTPSYAPTSSRPAWIANPDYPALPESADPVLRIRAWLAAAMAVLALLLAYRLERRALRRNTFEGGMLALFVLAGVWALLGVVELAPQRMVWYAAIWIAAAVGLTKHAEAITEWLPGDQKRPRHHLPAVPAGLLRPTLPTVVLLLGVWYAGGVVL